jgi:hypothetical protein
MSKVIAYQHWSAGARLHVVCPDCFQRALDHGTIWRAKPNLSWFDNYVYNPIRDYFDGEKPPRMQCDDCDRPL